MDGIINQTLNLCVIEMLLNLVYNLKIHQKFEIWIGS